MKFWPFPVLRNYEHDPAVTALFEMFLAQPDLQVKTMGVYTITLCCGKGEVKFWSSNKYYAYANEGAGSGVNGRQFAWRNAMPSRYVVRKLAKRLAAISAEIFEAV